MESFNAWWGGLSYLNQWFFVAAAFFSVVFLWQMIMAIMGIGGHEGAIDSHAEHDWEHQTSEDAAQTVVAFQLLSVRSILAFFTLFTWAGALYLSRNVSMVLSLTYAALWGIAAMVIVSGVLFMMRKMSETGNIKIASCVGTTGTVYLDIPAGGLGEVRVLCGGVMTHFKARLSSGSALKAGAVVKVTKAMDGNTIEVEPTAGSVK